MLKNNTPSYKDTFYRFAKVPRTHQRRLVHTDNNILITHPRNSAPVNNYLQHQDHVTLKPHWIHYPCCVHLYLQQLHSSSPASSSTVIPHTQPPHWTNFTNVYSNTLATPTHQSNTISEIPFQHFGVKSTYILLPIVRPFLNVFCNAPTLTPSTKTQLTLPTPCIRYLWYLHARHTYIQ